ncbi:MAG: nitrous oxide-stimulated promoter family protein [Coprobacillus sp.]
MNIDKKRERERNVVICMIQLYCRHHDDINEVELITYASQRIQKCPMMETKTFCSQCSIHCYEKNMQEKMKRVMRYSGPRMILIHPLMVIRHALKI